MKSNRSWFLDSVARFKPPSPASRLALDSPQISVGSRQLLVKPELKEAALRVSSCLFLDEVQSYILVKQSIELNKPVVDFKSEDFLHLISVQYYFERQCLLKCIRRLFLHALCLNNGSCATNYAKVEALQLIHDGLERKLLSVLMDLLSSVTSEKSEVDHIILWVEESIIEDNLVLDIIFLAYYDNFSSCSCEQWKNLCSLFKDILCGSFSIEKLAVSVEARTSFDYAKYQLLLILIETLDLENLLRMVHDEVPYRQGYSVFTLSDVQEMDALVSCFLALGDTEAGPLILAWAVFICLLLTLPERTEHSILTDIDHIGYLRQAFESAPFCYLHEVVRDTLRNSDGPVSGYLSVLRTLISAFIASYEINQQAEDSMLNLILDILCEIYHGEESLCMQFWDRDSLVDGPIRSLLYVLESEYPFHTVQLVRFLSSLCSGVWSAQCVYNYLEKMSGITLLSEIPCGFQMVNSNDIIESQNHIDIPTVEGIVIPSGTYGRILRIIGPNTALVRWEFAHSGLFLLLLRLAQKSDSFSYEEASIILELFDRMISSNTALCFSLLHIEKSVPTRAVQNSGHIKVNVRVDMVEIIAILVVNLLQDVNKAYVLSVCINILVEMLKCAPTYVVEVVSRSNIFGMAHNGSLSTSLLSGGLTRMLLGDNGETNNCFLLTTSVLDFTIQLVENGGENDLVSALVVFSLQYVLVNHMHWKYKMKYARWKVTLKVLEVIKSCTRALRSSHKLGPMIRELLMFDSSIHNFLCHILCISPEDLEGSSVGHHNELKVTEDLQLAVCSALDIVHTLLGDVLKSQENFSSVPTLVRTMLSSTAKPISLVTATVTLLNFFHESAIQVASAKLFSVVCVVASSVQPYTSENVSLVVDSLQIKNLTSTVCRILDVKLNANEELIISIFELLTSIACYQPALLVSIMVNEEDAKVTPKNAEDVNNQLAVAPIVSVLSTTKSIDLILEYVRRAEIHINSAPRLLLNVLNLLKALWDGGAQYIHILDKIRSSEMFWKHLAAAIEANINYSIHDLNDPEVQTMMYRYWCQGLILEIMARELFLQEKLLQNEISEMKTTNTCSKEQGLSTDIPKPSYVLPPSDILSTWCTSSTMDSLIRSFSSSGYDKEVILRAERAVCLFIVHLIALLSSGNAGNLSISLVEKSITIHDKLTKHPAFSALLSHYSQQGYSEGKELTSLLLNDLYYHLHGELEGRQIHVGAFQEISDFLLELETFQSKACKDETDKWPPGHNINMFDVAQLREDLGIELWDHSNWGASKEIAEKMLLHMHEANLIMSISNSKHFSLEALISIISVHYGNVTARKQRVLDNRISKKLIEPSITYVCNCLQKTSDTLIPSLNPPVVLLKILAGQAELLLILSMIFFRQNSLRNDMKHSLDVSSLLIKTSCSCIRFLADVRPSILLTKAVKFLLLLLLTSVEFSCLEAYVEDKSGLEADHFAVIALTSTGLLPILCKYVEHGEYSNLSVSLIDLMLKVSLAPATWLPIIEKHLHLQHIVQRIQQTDALVSIHVTLNLLLTLSRTKTGAELLYSANLFTSLKGLFSQLLNDKPFSTGLDGNETIFSNDEAPTRLWGLGLAIITSMTYFLGDDPSCVDILDNIVCYFFSEKAYIVSCYLSVPSFPADDQSKKRSRNQTTGTSLSFLRLTEDTLILMCVLARHQPMWSKRMKEMDSELRERSIHLLAFTSRAVQRSGESPIKSAPFFCPPRLKEEVELNERPSLFNSKHGWFALCALRQSTKTKLSVTQERGLSLVIKDQTGGNADLINHTQFTDTVAIQMYRIAFLLLQFLCMQAKAAVKRAEELEFIDLAHFPELPMPEILHGLQDQAIAIVTELCNSNRQKPNQPEMQGICFLLLQILEKSLYLELCVSQSCGIRPVLGRVEDFSKAIKLMVPAVEQHSRFKESLRSLRQIVEQLYPGLLQTCSLI